MARNRPVGTHHHGNGMEMLSGRSTSRSKKKILSPWDLMIIKEN
jgi:hypothetical protein